MLPNFLYIGPGRAGSDWITKNLSLHPDIFIPRQKGTSFFTRKYSKGIDWYSDAFGNRKEKAVGEATVGYLHHEEVPALVARHLPDIKLIASLRDPVDRAFSSYGRLTGKAKPGDANFDISFEEKILTTPRLLEQGLYARHLRRWFEFFPAQNFLILTFDDMQHNPDQFLRSIYRFLGVDVGFESPLVHQRLNASATIGAKSKLLYRIYRGFLRFRFFKLSRVIDTANRAMKVAIRPDTRVRLINEFFLHDIEELELLINRDLSKWKK